MVMPHVGRVEDWQIGPRWWHHGGDVGQYEGYAPVALRLTGGRAAVVTNHEYMFKTREEIEHLRDPNGVTVTQLLEPAGRNTAPAIAIAAIWACEQNPQATLLVLATVAVGVPHAQAAFPGRNGALALGGWASSGSCGEQVPRLGRAADSDGCAFQPPSPALYLAWLDRRRTERSFWPMCEGGFRGDARFSPGGARLVCRTRAGRIVVRSAGSAVDLGAGARAAWSPDGSRVVIEQRARLYVRQVGGGHAQFLRLGSSPAWSKRGEIAYVRDETLFVMDSRGRRPREIASSKLRRHIEVGPDWAPDGERIAFAACPNRTPRGAYNLALIPL